MQSNLDEPLLKYSECVVATTYVDLCWPHAGPHSALLSHSSVTGVLAQRSSDLALQGRFGEDTGGGRTWAASGIQRREI